MLASRPSRERENPRRLSFPSFLLTATLLLIACGGDETGDLGDRDDDGSLQTFRCTISLRPIELEYVVNGNTLEVRTGEGSDSWERVAKGDPARPVYGTWHVGTDTTPGVGTMRFDLLIERDQVTALGDCDFGAVSASVNATSAAEITDTAIRILESDADTEVITL